MKPREGHKKGREYLQRHPHISIRGSVDRSVHHNFMIFSENQPFSINRSQAEHVMSHIIMQSFHQAKGRIVGRMGLV